MSQINWAQAFSDLAIIVGAVGSWQQSEASVTQYLMFLDKEKRNPSKEEFNVLIAQIEANQVRINELAAQ